MRGLGPTKTIAQKRDKFDETGSFCFEGAAQKGAKAYDYPFRCPLGCYVLHDDHILCWNPHASCVINDERPNSSWRTPYGRG